MRYPQPKSQRYVTNHKNMYVLQIGAALFYHKLGQMLLQIVAALLLQIRATVIIK